MKTCPRCNKTFEFADDRSIKFCPACGESLLGEGLKQETSQKQCPVCCSEIEPTEECFQCPDCGMWYHKECWEDNKGCATYGCNSARCLEPPPLKIDPEEGGAYPVESQDCIICPQCSTRNSKDVTFCWSCGHTFEKKEKEIKTATPPKQEKQDDSETSWWWWLLWGIVWFIWKYYRSKNG